MAVLHGLILPDLTRKRLADLVHLQLDLLDYAAEAKAVELESCAAYLERKGSRFVGLGCQIAEWFFDSRATTRKKLLQDFADACQRGQSDQQGKQTQIDWRARIRQEVDDLLNEDTLSLVVDPFFPPAQPPQGQGQATAPTRELVSGETKKQRKQKIVPALPGMQAAAKEFFLYFYVNYLGKDEKLPAKLFTDTIEEPFGRQAMLDAFIASNAGLEICAVCDQSRYYTCGQDKTYSILDHYFPKDLYPHFACHPYNLIPVCYTCNSSVKGMKDPFLDGNKQRRALSKLALPYHKDRLDLAQHAYLKVETSESGELVQIGELCPRPDSPYELQPYIEEAITLLQEIYELPDSWSNSGQAIKINDILFRRMRHFFNDGNIVLAGTQVEVEIYDMLKHLLYCLSTDDQRRDPYAFALTWLLVAYLKEKTDAPNDASSQSCNPTWQALIEEINSWSGQSLDLSLQRNAYVERLLKLF